MSIPADAVLITHADGNKLYRRGSVNDGKPPTDMPNWGWFQAWTDRAASPLTVKRTPFQIVASRRSFPVGDTGCAVLPLEQSPVFAGPMDNAGVVKYMPGGGGGSDRGLVTDYAAHFMRTGEPKYMFAQAMAADSVPINYIDIPTGKPSDLLAHPYTNTYGSEFKADYQPFFPKGAPLGNPAGDYGYSGGWTPSTDHFPALSYTAFEASRDIGLLYNLQFAANFAIIEQPYVSAHSGMGVALIGDGQTRQLAWGLRMMFEAWAATLDAEVLGILPADLHPSSYFRTIIGNCVTYYTRRMNDPNEQTFRLLGPNLGDIGPWQVDYLISALAFGVLVGLSELVPLYLWVLGNWVARLNGTSGWPIGFCTAYKIDTVQGGQDGSLPRFTWAQCFDNQMVQNQVMMSKADHDAILANPNNLSPLQDTTYLMGAYMIGVTADYLDAINAAGVRAKYKDFDACLANVTRLMKSYGKIAERFSVISTTKPEIDMSDTKLAVGETKHITTTVSPDDADRSGLSYSAAPDGLVTLAPDSTGVNVTRVAKGTATITASLNGLTAQVEALDSIPLASAISLSWDS